MTRQIRSRRAGLAGERARARPLYARLLALRHLNPSGLLCFIFLEGAVALGILLALAELVSWWGVLVLPLTVALMVKLNDVVAGAVSAPSSRTGARARTSAAGRSRSDVRRSATSSRTGGERSGPSTRGGAPAGARHGGTRDEVLRRPLDVSPRRALDEAAPADRPVADSTGEINPRPVGRSRDGRAEQLDSPQRLSRQSASRRYE
jgi:hypothetical protein